jgi:GntR family transcriptional regulator, transcriptional repressor for pyruvate dehydrogenase complex
MYEPIERRKVYELISERLLAEITERRLVPGDTLPPERELTRVYRAGRSSVREALRMLESRGLIQPVGNGSFVVSGYGNPLNSSLRLLLSLEQATMLDIFELRRILESEAAGLAAERRTEVELARMDAGIEDMADGLAGAGSERYIDGDLRFHLAIAEATRNGLIVHSMHALREVIRRALMSIFLIPESPIRSLEQHREIRAAIAAGDAEGARTSMCAHLVDVESAVRRGLAPAIQSGGVHG